MHQSHQVLFSLKAKSTKYQWANDMHIAATNDRARMANSLFFKLCSLDTTQYYQGLYDSFTEDQLSALVAGL